MTPPIDPMPARSGGNAFWWACAIAAPPLAWAAAAAGYGIARGEVWRDLAFLALWSVVEEVVFRGGVQRALRRWPPVGRRGFAGISLANAVASALFAAAHLWAHPPLAALGVLPVSLVLGAAFERSGERLAPPIALHLYFNALLYACTRLLTL